jgi:hypothetical protein
MYDAAAHATLAIDSMRNSGKPMSNNDAQVDFAIELPAILFNDAGKKAWPCPGRQQWPAPQSGAILRMRPNLRQLDSAGLGLFRKCGARMQQPG